LKPIAGQLSLFINDSIILFFYMDDIVLLGRDLETINTFKSALMSCYKMRDLRDLDWFLDIRVIQNRPACKLWFSQDTYINKLITKFHLELHQPVFTSLPADKLIPNNSIAVPQQIYAFQ